MRKLALIALAVVLAGMLASPALAKDEFEDGLKMELGAITARSAVGLGIGVVNGIFGGGIAYNGFYAAPAPIYRERVVYVPPPVRYRVVKHYHYAPPPPPVVVHRHYVSRDADHRYDHDRDRHRDHSA